MKRFLAAVLVLLLILVAGIYFGSPLYAVRALQNAARAGDSEAIAAGVDFPAVRASLKPQLATALRAKIGEDSELRDNPLAALGALLAPTLAKGALDLFVTPEGIAALMQGRRPGGRHEGEANPDVDRNAEYLGLNLFVVRLHDNRKKADGPSFYLARRGFASWKLVRVDLPPNFLAEKPIA